MKDSYKPEWVEKLENWGKEQNKKFSKPKKEPWLRSGELFGEIFGDVIGLLVVNLAPVFFPNFFTSSYSSLLAVANTVIVMQILISSFLFLLRIDWIYYLGKSAHVLLGFVSVAAGVAIFPFNVPYGIGYLFRFALGIVAVVCLIVSVVYLIKAIIRVIRIK